MNVGMARLGKRERARRRSTTCNQLMIMDLKNTEIAVKKTMEFAALLHRQKAAAAVMTTLQAASEETANEEMMVVKTEERVDIMQREKKKLRSIEEVALKKMELAQAALRCSVGTEAMSEEKLTKLHVAARGLVERIEEMAEVAQKRGIIKARERGLRAETCRLKRKVGRLQESKRALKKEVREAKEALQRQYKELEERTLCMICHDLPRDTFILPCLHFLYCFSCLSKHSSSNNSCPSCRRSILGLCMASSLAST